MKINDRYLNDVLVSLVSTDSVNPSLVDGGAGESAVADLVAGRMAKLGLEVTVLERQPGRPSVVGVLPGRGGGRSLTLNGHIDTVGVEAMAHPFSAEVRDGRLYGRGAYDMKASVAACLAAVEALRGGGVHLNGDLVVAAVADEEYASLGTAEVLERFRTDGAVVTEPTALDICRAHKGFAWFEIRTAGRAAHGSQHQLGIDANLHMGRVLAGLEALSRELQARAPHPLVGLPSLHAAILEGGSGWSTYAASCSLKVERRTIPGEDPETVRAEIEAILNRLAGADDRFRAELEVVLVREAFEVGQQAAVVQACERAATEVLGAAPNHRGENPWMDSALLSAAGVETVVIGPAGEGAHAAVEWVDLESVRDLAAILARTACLYCGAD